MSGVQRIPNLPQTLPAREDPWSGPDPDPGHRDRYETSYHHWYLREVARTLRLAEVAEYHKVISARAQRRKLMA